MQPHEISHLDQGNVLVRVTPGERITLLMMWVIRRA